MEPEEETQGDHHAEELRHLGGDHGPLDHHPVRDPRPPAAPPGDDRCQVLTGGDPELGRHVLQQEGEDVGDDQDPQKPVPEPAAAGEVGAPVARVHVADRHEEGGTGEGDRRPEARAAFLHRARCNSAARSGADTPDMELVGTG